jgi:hypothetical protein
MQPLALKHIFLKQQKLFAFRTNLGPLVSEA